MTTDHPPDGLPAVARGGPLDGTVLGAADGDRYEVVMADRSRWEYVATTEHTTLVDGSAAVVFDCRGRV